MGKVNHLLWLGVSNLEGVRGFLGVETVDVLCFFRGVESSSSPTSETSKSASTFVRFLPRFLVAVVSVFRRSAKLCTSASVPRNISSHINSSVYVAVRVLQPRRQIKVFPWSFDRLGTLPVGYFLLNTCSDSTVAFPLIDSKGAKSHAGEIYSSFCMD